MGEDEEINFLKELLEQEERIQKSVRHLKIQYRRIGRAQHNAVL